VTDKAARGPNPWAVLGVLLLLYVANLADRYLITGLIGPIKAEFALSDGLVGLIMGPAFVVLYVILGVPLARLADRGSRIRIIAAGCAFWSAATFATGLATGPVSLSLARVAVGIGEAAFVAPAYSLLSDYFRPERRGLVFAIMGLATYAGQIVGQGGGPALAAVAGWRWVFWSMGILGIALAALAWTTIREPVRKEALRAQALPLARMLALFARSRAAVLVTASMSFGMISGVAFGYWAPELFTRRFGLDPVAVKSAFAINFGLSGLAGTILFGLIIDRAVRKGMVWPARLTAISMALATAFIMIASHAPDFRIVTLLAIPAGAIGGGWSVGLLTTVQHMFPSSIRAGSTLLYLGVSTLIGQFAGPFAVGLLSDRMGADGQSLLQALTLIIPLGFVGALCAWIASNHVIRDQSSLEQALV